MSHRLRLWVVLTFLIIWVLAVIWRMVDLMVINRSFLEGQGNARSLRIVSLPAYRGIITDRNGEPLAVSTPVDSVWADPQNYHIRSDQLENLATLLNMHQRDITQLIDANHNRQFVYLERDIDPAIGRKIKALKIPGVYLGREFRRYYPEGEVLAQIIGFNNIDDQGQDGLELQYNKWLAGKAGKKEVLQDRLGHIVQNVALMRAPQPGRDLALSIDRRIQYLAYSALKQEVEKTKAASGSVVVLDVRTGEILAMADAPSFNPNDRPEAQESNFRNRAVTDVFEPGSTMKPFGVYNALKSGKYTPNTLIDTSPGSIMVDGREIDDDGDYGILTVTGVLQKSSNVGATKMVLSLPPDELYNRLREVGFGQKSALDFPGESQGILIKRNPWPQISLATMAFGYGIAVTNIQLAHAYMILADGGIDRPVSLIREDTAPKGKQILDPKITKEIVQMLESVVETGAVGTAPQAAIPGYLVAGKTGTARLLGPHGYELNHHTADFVGIAPASDPRLVVSVEVRDPDPGGSHYFGGEVAGPVFAKVMAGALRILDVPPDNLNPSAKPNVTSTDVHP